MADMRRFLLLATPALTAALAALSCADNTTVIEPPPYPSPSLFSVSPSSVLTAASAFTLTAHGADFVSGSHVRWNGADLSTAFVSDSVLTASVPAGNVAVPGTAAVTVYTGTPGGGTSGSVTFTIEPPPPLTWDLTTVVVADGTWDATISATGVAYATRLSRDSIARIDIAGNSLLGSFAVGNWPYEVTFNASGTLAWATHAVDNTVKVINTSTHAVTTSYTMAAQPIRVRVNGAGNKLYVTHTDGNVAIVNPATGAQVSPPVNVGGVLNGIALTPNGTRLWVANTSGLVAEINTATDLAARSISMGGRPQDLAISSDGTTLYVANEDGWVGVYNLANLARVDSIPAPGAFGLALSPDGMQLWVSRSVFGAVTVFYTSTRAFAGTVPTGGVPRHIAFAANGTALIANEAGKVQIARPSP
jgi:DNA-binding beta-propeller fold protein YncE